MPWPESSVAIKCAIIGSDFKSLRAMPFDLQLPCQFSPLLRPDSRAILALVAAIRSCTVAYQDLDGITHSVDVTAETLYEAAILGMNALNVPRWHDNPNLKIQVRVRQPETNHEVWNSALSAWLARAANSPKEQALKARLRELVRG